MYKICLRLSLIFSEICTYYLFYYVLTDLVDNYILLSPLYFFISAGIIGIINILLSFGSHRIFTILLINLAMISASAVYAYVISGKILFSLSDPLTAYSTLLFQVIFLLSSFRSIYLSHKKRPDVYLHFDLFIVLSFVILTASEMAEIRVANGMLWIISIFFFNLIPLYIQNNTDRYKKYSGRLITAAAIIFILIMSGSYSVLPDATDAAGTVFDLFSVVFTAAANIFAYIIAFLMKRPIKGGTAANSERGDSDPTGGAEGLYTGLGWVDFVMQLLLWFVVILAAIVTAIFLYYLIRRFISWLIRIKPGEKHAGSDIPDISLKHIFMELFAAIKNVFAGIRLLIWNICMLFPFGRRVNVYKAYSRLLVWGSKKRMPRKSHETPYEYCFRLSDRYPDLSYEFNSITETFVLCIYSGTRLPDNLHHDFRPVLRKMYLFNLSRLKRKLF